VPQEHSRSGCSCGEKHVHRRGVAQQSNKHGSNAGDWASLEGRASHKKFATGNFLQEIRAGFQSRWPEGGVISSELDVRKAGRTTH
jgi:hypothetical protein